MPEMSRRDNNQKCYIKITLYRTFCSTLNAQFKKKYLFYVTLSCYYAYSNIVLITIKKTQICFISEYI